MRLCKWTPFIVDWFQMDENGTNDTQMSSLLLDTHVYRPSGTALSESTTVTACGYAGPALLACPRMRMEQPSGWSGNPSCVHDNMACTEEKSTPLVVATVRGSPATAVNSQWADARAGASDVRNW